MQGKDCVVVYLASFHAEGGQIGVAVMCSPCGCRKYWTRALGDCDPELIGLSLFHLSCLSPPRKTRPRGTPLLSEPMRGGIECLTSSMPVLFFFIRSSVPLSGSDCLGGQFVPSLNNLQSRSVTGMGSGALSGRSVVALFAFSFRVKPWRPKDIMLGHSQEHNI